MTDLDRNKLETAIEQAVYKFTQELKEHMYDHTMIYISTTQSSVDREVVDKILEIAKTAIEDGFMTKIDFFKENITTTLNNFTMTTNPLVPGESKKREKK